MTRLSPNAISLASTPLPRSAILIGQPVFQSVLCGFQKAYRLFRLFQVRFQLTPLDVVLPLWVLVVSAALSWTFREKSGGVVAGSTFFPF